MFGKLIDYSKNGQVVNLTFENANGSITVITPEIIRVFSGDETIKSKAIVGNKQTNCCFDVIKEEDVLKVITEKFIICIKDDFKVDFLDCNGKAICKDYIKERKLRTEYSDIQFEDLTKDEINKIHEHNNHKIEVIKALDGDECFYGLGDKAGLINKRHYSYEMWNTDAAFVHIETNKSLYKSIPFFMALKKNCCYGIFFDNTFKTFFDMGKESDDYCFFAADKGNLDYYFFGGNNLKAVLENYTYLTGRTPLPSKWTLGYHQSRWSYKSENEVRELVKTFREKHIPLDTIHLDIDYMEEFEDFTFNKEKFPNPKKLCDDLKHDGVKIVTIIDAGVKKKVGYKIYDDGIKNDFFVKDTDGSVYENVVWPGDSVFPDMGKQDVRNWWADNQKDMADAGVSGIWNDMNEPASFKGAIPDDVVFSDGERYTTHEEMHNVFGSLMSEATFKGLKKHTGKRPFVITRACFAGVQKYSTVWTGDNYSTWNHLRMAIPQLCNLSLSGISFVGTDVGGFLDDTTPELLTRWVEVGSLSPLFRNHSELCSIRQEPWVFGKKVEDIYRKFVELRYKLIPYFYDSFFVGERTGLPVISPLLFNFDYDKKLNDLSTQFMIGENLIAAPVVEQGATERIVYLPNGTFYDYFSGEKIEGGKSFIKKAELDELPLFVKAGAIIPNYPVQNYVGEKEIDELTLNVFEGNGKYHHFVDDGETFAYRDGAYNEYLFTIDGNKFESKVINNGFDKTYKTLSINFNSKNYKVDFNEGNVNFVLD